MPRQSFLFSVVILHYLYQHAWNPKDGSFWAFDNWRRGCTIVYAKDRVKGKTSKATITHQRLALLKCIIVLTTGSSDGGIGAEAALSLSTEPPTCLILAGRSLPKIQTVIDHVSRAYPDVKTPFTSLDLSSQHAIREAAASISKSVQHIDILIPQSWNVLLQRPLVRLRANPALTVRGISC